jgi:hypothetical protein
MKVVRVDELTRTGEVPAGQQPGAPVALLLVEERRGRRVRGVCGSGRETERGGDQDGGDVVCGHAASQS